MVEGQRLAEWLSRLVRTPSVSPDQAGPKAGEPGEARIAAGVARWFQDLGGEVAAEEVTPGRPNVYGIWRGRSERWAAVDVHMDTVGVEQMTGDPFSGEIREGRVWGRGAVDTKATLAVALGLLEALQQAGQRPEPNLLIAATMDEESTAQGAPAFARWVRGQGLQLDQLAVAEPTQCGPVHGHKGAVRFIFEVNGVPAHSSQPHLGKNAITAAAHLVIALDEEHRRLQEQSPETPLGNGTLTVSLVQGGTGTNVVPDRCTLTVDRRTVPGEAWNAVEARFRQIAVERCPLPFRMEPGLHIDPFFQPSDSPWVRQLAEWSGREPSVVPYGTNAWAYGDLARECVVIGPGSIAQAHGVEEWVEISELEKIASIYGRWWGVER